MKMSTSWGTRPYQDLADASAADTPTAPPPTSGPLAPAPTEVAQPPAEEPPKQVIDAASLVAQKARNVLDGLRG